MEATHKTHADEIDHNQEEQQQGMNLIVDRSSDGHKRAFAQEELDPYFQAGQGDSGEGDRIESEQFGELPLVFQFPGNMDDSAKVYSCHICNFKTAFKNSLVNHQAVHSDARPWICEICDYAAKRKQDLKKHLQTMHGLVVDSLALKPGINPFSSSASSSSLTSPVESKPHVANSSPLHVNAAGSMHGHQQVVNSSIPPVPTSVQMTGAVPGLLSTAGKFLADKFPYSQVCSDVGVPKPGLPPLSVRDSNFLSSMDSDTELSDDISMSDHKKGPVPRNVHYQSVANSKRLPSVREMLLKDKLHHSSNTEDKSLFRTSSSPSELESGPTREQSKSSGIVDHWHCELETESKRGRKQILLDSYEGRSPDSEKGCSSAKMGRYLFASELSAHVTSQSDQGTNMEPMSSTVMRSKSLETKRSFHCAHCDILFFENALYLMHMGLHDGTNPWKCAICKCTFFEKYSFTSHFINQH